MNFCKKINENYHCVAKNRKAQFFCTPGQLDKFDDCCQYMDEHTTGISFIYYEARVDLNIVEKYESLHISYVRHCSSGSRSSNSNSSINIAPIIHVTHVMPLSEFDLCNPYTTPSERFQVIESHLDQSCSFLCRLSR